jgi:hypothetical protein
MLLTSTPAPPAGDGWVHEAKLDGWRCLAEASAGRVQVRSRRGGDYTSRLPELQSLSHLGDAVLDGELVVITDDGRADFELLSTRVNGRNRRPTAEPPVTLYAFDVLRLQGRDLCGEPWTARRAILEGLDLGTATSGVVRTVSYSADGEAMHQATLAIGAEGTVSKKAASVYLPGQRVRWWTKTKHWRTAVFPVVGWRPSTPFPARRSDPGGGRSADWHRFLGATRGQPRGAGQHRGAVRAVSSNRGHHGSRGLPERDGALHQPDPHPRPAARSGRDRKSIQSPFSATDPGEPGPEEPRRETGSQESGQPMLRVEYPQSEIRPSCRPSGCRQMTRVCRQTSRPPAVS